MKLRCIFQALEHVRPSPIMGQCIRISKAASEPTKSACWFAAIQSNFPLFAQNICTGSADVMDAHP